MMRPFEQSNKTSEESISKLTMCLTSIEDGIASGMQMLAIAFPKQPLTTSVSHVPPVSHKVALPHHLRMVPHYAEVLYTPHSIELVTTNSVSPSLGEDQL